MNTLFISPTVHKCAPCTVTAFPQQKFNIIRVKLFQHLAPGRLEVPVSIGTPTNAASSPSAVSWKGNLPMVEIPDTLATNSALIGTL